MKIHWLLFVCVGVDSAGLYAQWRHEEPLGPHGCWVRESSTVNSVHTPIHHVFLEIQREGTDFSPEGISAIL